MPLRVQIVGINTPNNVIKTIHQDTLLNLQELKHTLPEDYLHRALPPGAGVHFDFGQSGIVALRPEGQTSAMLNGEPMQPDSIYHLELGANKILHIGDIMLRAHVIHSHF